MTVQFNKIENIDLNQQVWMEVRALLHKTYGDSVFNNWIKHLDYVGCSKGEMQLCVPSRFIKEWISSNYKITMVKFLCQNSENIKSVNIIVKKVPHGVKNTKKQEQESKDKKLVVSGSDVTGQNINLIESVVDDNFSSPLDRRFTFENYIVGQSNQLAFAAAQAIAMQKKVVSGNNPLYLYGGVGHGKTHLMHAIAWHIRNHNPDKNVIYLSAEKFMYQFVRALRDKNIMEFKDRFRSIDVLMIDDVQFICGKESTQEEFFHTVNYLLDRNKQIVISGDRSPSELDGMKERVRSRLGWGLVIDINKTDFELRLGILKSKIAQMDKVDVPEQVLEFLASKISSNTRELEGALNKVVAHSTLMGNKITIESTRNILSDLLRSNEVVVTIAMIQKKVSEYFDVKLADLKSARRARSIARPRQIAMYLCKNLTLRSLAEIGRKFGGRDHTTVIHAVKKIDALIKTDKEIEAEVNMIIRNISGA